MKHFDSDHFSPTAGTAGASAPLQVQNDRLAPMLLSATIQQVRAAQEMASFYKEALDEAAIVAVTDPKGTILSVNGKFCELSGYAAEELIGSNHRILKSGVHDRDFFRAMYRTIARGEIWHGEICNRAKSGRLYWVDTTIVPHRGSNGRIETYTAIRFDITPQKTAEERLWRLANIDVLTELPNRLKFMDDLDATINDPAGHDNGIVVGLMDIDHFKDINDSLGHAAGDELLRQVALRIRESLAPRDEIARLGGDEFALIFRDCHTRADKDARIARIFAALGAPLTICGTERSLSASLGVARFPNEGDNSSELLKNADIALYAAKAMGRGRAEVFSARMRERVQRRAELRSRFESGLRSGEFRVMYQPILPLGCKEPIAMEALLRWSHPEHGLIQPPEFIEALSDETLAAMVDSFVLERVLQQIQQWRRDCVPFTSVAVNATLGDFRTAAYVDRILHAIRHGLIDRQDLCVEITEDMLLGRGGGRARIEIERLHQAGVRVAFDDFGTGFASLRHLRDLPVGMVKIDKSFICSLETDQADRAVVMSVIELAHRLGKKVTAEGVETRAQAAILELLGCDRIQGYLVSRALTAEDMEQFVRQRPALAA